MNADDVLRRDEQMHLPQQVDVVGRLLAGAVEDEEPVVAVVVELRSLAEVGGVLERERMKLEDLTELIDLRGARVRQVGPEEPAARGVVADAVGVQGREARDRLVLRGRCWVRAHGSNRDCGRPPRRRAGGGSLRCDERRRQAGTLRRAR